jgi:hypothetical protein
MKLFANDLMSFISPSASFLRQKGILCDDQFITGKLVVVHFSNDFESRAIIGDLGGGFFWIFPINQRSLDSKFKCNTLVFSEGLQRG